MAIIEKLEPRDLFRFLCVIIITVFWILFMYWRTMRICAFLHYIYILHLQCVRFRQLRRFYSTLWYMLHVHLTPDREQPPCIRICSFSFHSIMLLTEESSSKPPYACLSDPLTMRANIELCSSSRAQTKRLHPLNAPFSIPRPSCFFCSTVEQLGRIIELARYREIETSEFLPSTVNYMNTRYKTWESENRLNGQRIGSSTVKEKRIWFEERSVCFDLIIMMVRRDSVRNFTADFYWSETVKRPIFIPQTHIHVLTYTKRHTY